MVVNALSYSFAFSCLSACAIASPLSYLSPSSLLNTLNSTNSLYSFNVPPQANITVPASNVWPPSPPPNPFRYRVPNTDIAVEFSHQRCPPGGLNQRDVIFVVNYAFFDCVGKPPGEAVPLNTQDWTSGEVRFDRTPRSARPRSRDPRLTYADWCIALAAIKGFEVHYQGIDFLYNVYGEDEDYSLALGALRKLSPPPTESS